MRHIFSLKVMIPIIIIFALCNGLFIRSVSNSILYAGTAIIGFGASVLAVFYGSFVQGDGTMFTKGAKWIGLVIYAFFLFGSISVFISTYESTNQHDQTTENLRYIFSNFIFAFGYGTVGLIWSFLTTKSLGSYHRLPNKKEKSEVLQIEN